MYSEISKEARMSRTIFITEASSGIGATTASAAVAAGWTVGLMARNTDASEALAAKLGDAAFPVPRDVSDFAAQE
jgi:NADP-dependent 3-hydroxy acid dehydrogenase YdfG